MLVLTLLGAFGLLINQKHDLRAAAADLFLHTPYRYCRCGSYFKIRRLAWILSVALTHISHHFRQCPFVEGRGQ